MPLGGSPSGATHGPRCIYLSHVKDAAVAPQVAVLFQPLIHAGPPCSGASGRDSAIVAQEVRMLETSLAGRWILVDLILKCESFRMQGTPGPVRRRSP